MSNLNERVQRQLEVDTMIKYLGDLKHDKNSLRLAKEEGFGETAAGKRFTNQAVKGFVEKFNSYVDNQNPSDRKNVILKNLVIFGEEVEYKLDPSAIGKIVIRSLLRSLLRSGDNRITTTAVSFEIGNSIEYAIKEIQLDQHHAKDKGKLMDMLRRQEKLGDKEEIMRLVNSLSERVNTQNENWTKKTQGSLGEALVRLFYMSTAYINGEDSGLKFGDIFVEHDETEMKSGKRKTKKTVDISDVGTLWLIDNDEYIKDITLSFLPMVIEPQDWTIDHGGYFDQGIYDTYPLIKGYSRKKIKKLSDKYPTGFQTLMKTINTLQKTPFRVNETIWDAVNYVHQNEINLDRKGIPQYIGGWEKEIGAEKAAEFFMIKRQLVRGEGNYLTPESKKLLRDFILTIIEGSENLEDKDLWKKWSNIRKAVIKHSRAETSKRILIDNTLNDSQKFLDEDIYFCYNADYRGRIYPLAGQFSPQGSDISRGMLEFANGVTVDPVTDIDAIRQIAIVIANNFGEDKISLDDREMWTSFNTENILACADDFENNRWWMEADKPFLFLQGCLEWKKYIDAKESGETFVSTLPIGFDGSCNGIQHYSALFLDPVGAEAVNLINSDVPSDVYQQVADQALVIAKNTKGKADKLIVEINDKLEGKLFGRKVAKRSVMTLPYGVSKRSSNAYVYEEVDALLRKIGISTAEEKIVRSRMGNLIWEAILLVVEKPVTGKEYFQAVATEMAGWDTGLLWLTPTGFPVTQSLKKRDVTDHLLRVTITDPDSTLSIDPETGELQREQEKVVVKRKYPKYTSELDAGEQANAIAPNFVHSFDSSHLQFSVLAAFEEGLTNFLVIHDSFATDCLKAGRFNMIIREQFVKMYSTIDYINKFHKDCEMQLSEFDEDGDPISYIELATPQESRGNFDINQVLESEYFFS